MRFGIIGTGFIVERFLQAATPCPDFVLDAIFSRSPARAQELAARHGAAHIYPTLEDMLASSNVDAVYIASPNALHHTHAMAAMRAGNHVLCEKPAASNERELAEMLAVARECGVLFLEASRHLLAPYVQTLRGQLPALGAIRRASFVYNQYSSRYDKFQNGIIENAFNPALSNSALMDIGVYCVQLAIALFGEPKGICARSVLLHNGFEGQGFILADYGSMLAELSYSKISDANTPSSIQGERGALLFDPVAAPQTITLYPRRGAPQTVAFDRRENDMEYEVERFIAFVGDREQAAFYNQCSLLSLRLIDEARRQQGVIFPADGA